MFFFGDDDIDVMFEDMAVDVTIDGVPGRAMVNTPDELLLQGGGQAPGVIGAMIAILVKTNAFPAMTIGSEIDTADGVYIVRQPLRADDGALTRVLCTKM